MVFLCHVWAVLHTKEQVNVLWNMCIVLSNHPVSETIDCIVLVCYRSKVCHPGECIVCFHYLMYLHLDNDFVCVSAPYGIREKTRKIGTNKHYDELEDQTWVNLISHIVKQTCCDSVTSTCSLAWLSVVVLTPLPPPGDLPSYIGDFGTLVSLLEHC